MREKDLEDKGRIEGREEGRIARLRERKDVMEDRIAGGNLNEGELKL